MTLNCPKLETSKGQSRSQSETGRERKPRELGDALVSFCMERKWAKSLLQNVHYWSREKPPIGRAHLGKWWTRVVWGWPVPGVKDGVFYMIAMETKNGLFKVDV